MSSDVSVKKVAKRYTIDGVQKALRLAERLGDRETYNWCEIIRAGEEIMKNAPKDEESQEDARRQFLEMISEIDTGTVPAPVKPIVHTAKAILSFNDR